MLKNKKNSFTFVELVMVIAIIGILMLGMTIYLGTNGDRARSIEAEGCGNALGGALSNYVYYALTSKNLTMGDQNNPAHPTYYYIELTGGSSNPEQRCIPENSGSFCDEIILGYTEEETPTSIETYETLTIGNTCRHGKPHLGFYRTGGTSGDIQYIRMNKGFTPREAQAERVFFLQQNGDTEDDKLLTGNIMVILCSDTCVGGKEIGKRQIDARSQTIAFKKCKYYFEENGKKCKTREDCRVYSGSDPTVCLEY